MLKMLVEGLAGFGTLLGYYLFAGSLAAILTKFLKIPKEPGRKMFHILSAFSIFILLYGFRTWYVSALSALMFALVIYPILSYAERYPQYRAILGERKGGEVKTSALLTFGVMALLTATFWGWQNSKYIVIVAVMTWGFGDAAAALVGKAFGRHFLQHKLIEGKKTVEGTLAMHLVSALVVFVALSAMTELSWYICLLVAALVAPICAITELLSRWGLDTVTVPISAALSTFALISLFGRLGW